MPEIISATRTAHGYFVSQLTDHITETPEGFLVVVGCPVARTGWQQYSCRDLPQEAAKDLGVDLSNPGASIDLYRPASEVFHPEFLASLNGKPIVDGHPPGFVDPGNFQQYAMGHLQNPRRGPQMEDGEWPVIADLVISSEPLVSKVKNGQTKDISLGYDYGIEKDGDRINQCSMMANHAAVVPKGRAGDLIAIGDEAPGLEPKTSETPAPPANQRAATSQTSTAVQPKKEKKPVPKNIVRHLLGLGLKAFAFDAEPEELAEAAEAVNNAPPDAEDSRMKDRKAKDRRAKDNDDPEDGVTEETETQDRQAAHDALDKMIDGLSGKKGTDRKRATDADIEALKDLLGDFLSEEEEEPEHAADISEEPEEQGIDADPSELEEVLGAGEAPDTEDEDEEEMEAEDGEECPCGEPGCPGCDEAEADPGEELEPSGEEALAANRAKARDSRKARVGDAHDGARAVLKMLRPFVARAKDESLKTAFNTALGSVSKRSRASDGGGYGAFAGAANDRSRARAKNPGGFRAHAADAAEDANAKMQAVYDQIRTGVNPNTGGK